MRIPKKPTSLIAGNIIMSSISLTWRDNSINESGFEIQRCVGASCSIFTQLAIVPSNTTQYTDNGLSAGTTYRYRVRALNSTGFSGFTNIASATIPAATPPPNPVPTLVLTIPANLTAISPDNNPVSLSLSSASTVGGLTPVTISYKVSGVEISLNHSFAVGTTTVVVLATSTDGQTASSSFTVTVTYIPTSPGAQRQITLSDLTWLGTFKSPDYLGGQGGAVTYPWFTLRRVGGVLKTMWITPDHGGFQPPNEVVQADYPGFNADLSLAPTAGANFRNFGNGFLSKMLQYDGSPLINGQLINGLTYDSVNNCIWITYENSYNTSGFHDPVLIRGDINDAAPDNTAITWSGPWRFTGTVSGSVATADSHQTQSYVVQVPVAYGVAHLGGATIALGGSYSSGGVASPFNNTLWAPALTPVNGTPVAPGGSDLTASCLIGGDITSGHRGVRPGDYTTQFCDPPGGQGDTDPTSYVRNQLTGTWGVFDNSGSAVWLNWTTIKGILFNVSHGRGHIWYNNAGLHPPPPGHCAHGINDRYGVTGPEAVVPVGFDSYNQPYSSSLIHNPPLSYEVGPESELALYIYNEDSFVQVAGGNPWDVRPTDWAYVLDRFPNFAVSKNIDSKVIIKPNAIAADETSRLIMIPCGYVTGGTTSGFGFYVNVFSVAP